LSKSSVENAVFSSPGYNSLEQEALIAMTALGIARSAAETAIRKALAKEPSFRQVEELIKAALKCL
jgi:Holliday junction DNA helicase RuvA